MTIGLTEWIQLFPLVLPFCGAFLIALIGKAFKERPKRAMGIITSIFMFLTIIAIALDFYTILPLYGLSNPWIDIQYIAGSGATLIHIDMLSILMSIMFAFLGFLVSVYSIKYMENDHGLSLYYALLLTLIGSMIGVTYSGDLFTLFIFWEAMSLSSYALVAFRKDEPEPIEAGIKYFLLSAVGSTLILFTMSLLYGLTGTVNLAEIGTAIAALPSSTAVQGIVTFTIVGLLIGFGVKAAIAPLATWLPDAHPAAPSGISAMLSGVVIMTGSYAILRTFLLFFDPSVYSYHGYFLSWFALFTMLYGNLMALTQKDIKRLLAYSTIVNVGYIIFGFSIAMMPLSSEAASYYSVTGSLFQMVAHMLSKGMLFLCSGIFLHTLHTRDLDQLRGVGRRMPVTMICFTIGALSLAGVPPLVGFYSKFFIIWGSILAGAYLGAAMLVLNSAFSVAYYLRVIQILVFSEPTPDAAKVKEASPIMLFSIVVLTIFIIGIGLLPHFFLTVANLAAMAAFG
ncbi:MAG: complex I subunit 5 family protein [Promethearchaeota archaeon]